MISNASHTMLSFTILIFFMLYQQSLAQAIDIFSKMTSAAAIFEDLTNSSQYNKWAMPPSEDGRPLEVKVRTYVYHLKAKESRHLDISMQILLELTWNDPRLSYAKYDSGLSIITGREEYLKTIWLPHIIFVNEKESHIMGSISKDNFVTILPSGLVLLTTRLTTSMFCILHLGNFPFDQQNCQLSISSWRYNSSALHLVWDEDIPLQMKKLDSSLPEFDVLFVKSESTLEDILEELNEEQHFSSLTIRMKLGRQYGYYFLNYYLPSVLLVIISWVSFWLEPSAVPARVTLGSSTMLTFIQLCWTAQGLLKVSEFMANDVWAVSCTGFIFLSLAEFAFVNTIDRKGGGGKVHLKKLSSKYILRGGVDTAAGRAKLRRSSSCPSSPEIRRHFASKQANSKTLKELQDVSISLSNLGQKTNKLGKKENEKHESHNVFTMTPQEIAIWIDRKSRIVFPLAFFLFNVVYWLPLIIVK